ncbi:flagellar M-ring protein FliF [Austwickia chelonae]|uniref:Flagellar M-ring protein n=1 Tax=Austwickia chelonae NBRC 105200 TaxID=1184607 RepID=K6VLY7_9MICO|nr:flagellar basal-body MS-ring/collar protein FliF [Austwickia chelonae]GAB77749.1 flagellar M-ring protein [Austwickia chelonae NBRC 105200]SEV88775.1 flagellar M-ring protein FliF [Austwickia chelonae]
MKNIKFQAVLGRAKGVFNGFTPGQRAVTVIAVVVAIVGAIVFVNWASKPTMTPIFTNLSSSDAAAISTKLKETGVPYELGNGGNSILVPSSQADQARLDLAGAGLPQNSPDSKGYGILDKSSLGSSDFQQKLTAKRAIEGELANTIKQIDKVRDAKVYLALGENSPYQDEQTKPSASVQVTMQSGAKLQTGQVDAVVHLVSSAVPKLESSAVTVTDALGTRYTEEGGGVGGLDARADQVRAVSAQKTAQVQKFLDTIVGPGNSTASVQADLDFDNTKVERQEYVLSKAGDPPVVEQRSTEKMTGASGQAVGGVLGPDNITVPGLDQGSSKNEYTKEDFTKQNPYGVQKTTKDLAKGSIKKLNVAIALDAKNAGIYNAAELKQLLGAAAGIDQARGDAIEVSKLAFDTKAAEAAKAKADAEAAQARQGELIDLAKNAGLVLLLLLALLIGFRKSRKEPEVVDLGELPSATAGELPPTPVDPPLEYSLESDPLPVIEATPVDPQSQARVLAREEIGSLVEEDPDEVARLLRGWISERN